MAKLQVASPTITADSIANTRTIGTNALWTIIGRVGPMLFAVTLTPALIRQLGPDRWGVFTLALSLIGMFGIFDFGIGRAITKNIGEAIGLGTAGDIASQVKTSLLLLLALGIAGGLVMGVGIEYWIRFSLKVPPALLPEARYSLFVLCLAVPSILLGGGMWGILAAYQQSKAATLISMPILVMYYAGPLLIFRLYPSLVAVTSLIVVLRLVATALFWRYCRKSIPALVDARIQLSTLGPVFKLSGWMTISNILWPILAYVDRFTIASFVSTAAVGYYSTAGDLITRLYVIPAAITGSIFPAIAASNAKDPQRACQIIRRGLVTITTVMFPISAILLLFGTPLLRIWLGSAVALHVSPLVPWFALGLIFAASDTLIVGVIDSLGYPKLNSQFSVVELLLYVPFMGLCLKLAGVQGAAITWCFRALIDFVVRLILLARILPGIREHLLRLCFTPTLAALLGTLCMMPSSPAARIVVFLTCCLVYSSLLWVYPLSDADRSVIQGAFVRRLMKTACA